MATPLFNALPKQEFDNALWLALGEGSAVRIGADFLFALRHNRMSPTSKGFSIRRDFGFHRSTTDSCRERSAVKLSQSQGREI